MTVPQLFLSYNPAPVAPITPKLYLPLNPSPSIPLFGTAMTVQLFYNAYWIFCKVYLSFRLYLATRDPVKSLKYCSG